MAKTTKTKKRRLIKTSDKRIEKKPKTRKLNQKKEEEEEQHQKQPDPEPEPEPEPETDSDSDSDSSSKSDLEDLPQLLEPYSKEQLIELITDAASKDSALYSRIRAAADSDVSHRKIFIHGFGWDTTRQTLVSTFEAFGEIEDCNVIMDKATGKAKGYGFVLFKTRRGAAKALKNPKMTISNRIASCQLASVGPGNNAATPSTSSFNGQSDSAGRKIYVSSVPHDADGEKLRALFAKFGEIEIGPIGFDSQTGKSRGFALFVYKTPEGAKKALEEPYKVFGGHQLHCQRAAESSKSKNSATTPAVQTQMQPPVLAAVAAAQNMALFGQHPSHNPMYGGLMANVGGGGLVPGSANTAMMARAMNPGMVGGALNAGVIQGSQVGQVGVGGYNGGSHGLVSLGGGSHGFNSLGGANPSSLLGAYGSGAYGSGAYGSSVPLPTLQGLQHVYPNTQIGQQASGRPQGASGSLTGYPSYMWYDILQLHFSCLSSMLMFLHFAFYAHSDLVFGSFVVKFVLYCDLYRFEMYNFVTSTWILSLFHIRCLQLYNAFELFIHITYQVIYEFHILHRLLRKARVKFSKFVCYSVKVVVGELQEFQY